MGKQYVENYKFSVTTTCFFSSICALLLEQLLPYFGKRKQVTKVTFLVKEQNVSVISTDVNAIS